MNSKNHPLDTYKRFLLSRSTVTPHFVEIIENLLATEDEYIKYCFHKIMIHHWSGEREVLFDMLSDYFSVSFIPVNVTTQGDITTFYSSSLSLIMRLIRLEFMFPHQRNMYNIDVLFNDKTSSNFFDNNITIDDVVSGVVSQRFNEKQELDLSNFCEDQEFEDKKIFFYKVSLLANFKLLMLRVGRDTKALNLSNNKLTHPPLDIMNFFIKGDLTEINLSYNLISSISDLVRVSSKIEKLWLEGNPLCEDSEPSMYVKHITIKFPRLVELDGIKLNEFGLIFPFNRNYISDPSRATKMVVEKFLTIYFTQYDSIQRKQNIEGFYDDYSTLTITCGFRDTKNPMLLRYAKYAGNILNRDPCNYMIYKTKQRLLTILSLLPATVHDPSTFTVDVLRPERKTFIVIVGGLFKEKTMDNEESQVLCFQRTFNFSEYKVNSNTVYHIQNELFYIALPTLEQIANSFKNPIRDLNSLELINPDREETETMVKIFCQITQLKKEEAEARLRVQQWDIKRALQNVISDVTMDKISPEHFIEEDDFSDSSSLIDDEMVD